MQVLGQSGAGHNEPIISPDGKWQVAGNGRCLVASTANPLAETSLFGENPLREDGDTVPFYQMGWINKLGEPSLLQAMEVLSRDVANIYTFAPESGWSRNKVSSGPFDGNNIYASAGHWSSLGGPLGVCVDGKPFTRPIDGSGWVQDGKFFVYQRQDFRALIAGNLETGETWTLTPPAGVADDNNYDVFDLGKVKSGEPVTAVLVKMRELRFMRAASY